jgi:hypothetical protein
VAKGKDKSGRLSVFKGREAKLNKATFTVLSCKGALTVYALLKEIKKQRGLTDTRYGVIRRRAEALEKQDYLMKVGVERTHVGSYAPVYQMTPRAELALALSKTDLDKMVKEANYAQIIEMVKTIKQAS